MPTLLSMALGAAPVFGGALVTAAAGRFGARTCVA